MLLALADVVYRLWHGIAVVGGPIINRLTNR